MSFLISKDIIYIFLLNTQKLTRQSDSENKSLDYPARKKRIILLRQIFAIPYPIPYPINRIRVRIGFLSDVQNLLLYPIKTYSEMDLDGNYPSTFTLIGRYGGCYEEIYKEAYDDRAYHAKGLDTPAKYAPTLEVRKGNARYRRG